MILLDVWEQEEGHFFLVNKLRQQHTALNIIVLVLVAYVGKYYCERNSPIPSLEKNDS